MELAIFFKQHPRVAVAFSGGVDSAYLLYAAKKNGAQVVAYYIKTEFQPEFEYADARRMARELGAPLRVVTLDLLTDAAIAANPADRCYFCKRSLLGAVVQAARADGFSLVVDGTNASDDVADRPGMKALAELGVRSPLRECGLTKREIRDRSKQAGLFTHDKPAYACLATRIPTGTPITRQWLTRTERGEDFLRGLGFSDVRIRLMDGAARLQLPAGQLDRLLRYRQAILDELRKHYNAVLLDLEVRDG